MVITNPLDGSPLTIYNQNPATSGGPQRNIVRNADFLNNHYNGFEVMINKRFGGRGSIMGGYAYGSRRGSIFSGAPSTADLNDANNVLIFPEGAVDFDQPHRVKFTSNVRLPWDIYFGAFFQYHTGMPKVRTLTVTRALVPTLTRATQTVRLEETGATRYDDIILLDVRFSKRFTFDQRLKIELFLDLYNVANRTTVISEGTAVGTAAYGRITGTVNPRLLKLGLKVDF